MFKVSARTVLELGSELISSDIIAFYELAKNAIDAKSPTGAEIHFHVVLGRNAFDRISSRADSLADRGLSTRERAKLDKALLLELKAEVANALDPAAGPDRVNAFQLAVDGTSTVAEFKKALHDSYRSLSTIEVSDTGTGMSRNDLEQCYLTIGTPSRKKDVDAAISRGASKVPYLGEKGIGRLSAMRLGDRLRVETARIQDVNLNVLDIDWTLFESLDAMVEDVAISPTRGPKKTATAWSGTRLIIGGLTEDWSEKRLRELALYDFARLTDPFSDPKLRPRIGLFWGDSRIAIPWMDRVLIDHAHASFRGQYTIEKGEPKLTVHMTALNLGYDHPRVDDEIVLTLPDLDGNIAGVADGVPVSALTSVGDFSFELYWYNRRYLTGIEGVGNQKAVRSLQRKWSGIMLFRDGFRVFPYGDEDDDWLGLDRRALGRTGYVLNKSQFVGHVDITRTGNPNLVDQTNREGLRSTPEARVFTAVLSYVVQDQLWSFFRDVDHEHKKLPIELVDVKSQVDALETRAKTAIRKVRTLVAREDQDVVDDLEHSLTEFRDLAARTQLRIEEAEAEGRQMVQMAGVGLMVEVIAHELARASESALSSLERLRGKDLPADLRSKLETLRSEMKTVSKRLRVLDELSVSGRQRAERFDLGTLLEDLVEGHAAQFERHRIQVRITKPKTPVQVELVKGMVVQILENLVSNSVYWTNVRSSRENRYTPEIHISLETNPLLIRYSDNGRGISPEHIERIFKPFWSLKEKGRRRGLGLYIARENAGYLGGSLTLSDRRNELDRLYEFVLELPASSRHR